ncbi:hypothetical protein CDD80_3704 [Ophiocordyceps camponoti-rufipedis]|uniref:Spc7 kinetochore protein domain-containing protein n=1 Tax=Ophiocordyceps camponoti-rufipedis TaxID=2004952 RepID=A0A2C5Z1T2_9HYPO|nr:hypothetical protein CDD80_3704 [Ophiocordyceps camponoti-rufipedis]
MFPTTDSALLATRRSRKSVGANPDLRNTMDRENATLNLASSRAASRKSRSKSMGPGGLEALKQINGNRRASLAAPVKLPRSILKPTIPPLPAIPPLKNGKKKTEKYESGGSQDSSRSLTTSSDEDSTGSKSAIRTDEEQQADTKEREERERRDARRKSLANRRVSFAAEATLHTFHEVEYMQDSTTSTDTTRRASSVADRTPGRTNVVGAVECQEDATKSQTGIIACSPDKQADLQQQRRRRRSSGIQSLNANGPDDDTVASTVYSSDSEPADGVEDMAEEVEEASSSDSDDGTMMTIDTDEATGISVASDRSGATDDDSTLDEALRIAARRASTQNLESADDNEDDDDGEEVIPSFGWIKKSTQPAAESKSLPSVTERCESRGAGTGDDADTEMDMDMDMTQSVGRILKPFSHDDSDLLGDVSMEVTQALGGILSFNKPSTAPQVAKDQELDDATMELTTIMGGIQRARSEDPDDLLDHEDMSMELTTVIGKVLTRGEPAVTSRKQETGHTDGAAIDDAVADVTSDIGQLMADCNVQEDVTMDMDMTAALGGIIETGEKSPRTLNKRILEEEVNRPNDTTEAIVEAVTRSPTRRASRMSQEATDSPGLSAFRGKGLRRSSIKRTSATPQRDARSRTPSPSKTAPQSPAKTTHQSPVKTTPQPPIQTVSSAPNKPETPQRRPSSSSKTQSETKSPKTRAASPTRRIIESQAKTPSPAKSTRGGASIFHKDPQTGDRTPNVVLTPPNRPLSGVGIDRPGLGSPKVAALCKRRCSIGDSASEFVLGKRTVAFEEPKVIEEEVDQIRREQEDQEDRVRILEREADGSHQDRDATLNLREMINSLSPKWKPLRGRKSLHVGSAKGLLGKRPAELDDDGDDDDDGVKRLKGHQSSPVKNVLLEQPTVGRLTRAARRSLEQAKATSTPLLSSPIKTTTPRGQARFKDVQDNQTVHEINLHGPQAKDDVELAREVEEEKIHLQDFLNMISIRFMELNTTKRRHTTAPGSGRDGDSSEERDGLTLERCVVAGACTVPMLELYQHSCRELKKYISEGRRMVKEIESETLEENPPLFREYMTAGADVKALMDHQFKNVKTHARLLSKAMWYEWRMKLQEGLREGLVGIAEGMDADDKALKEQQDMVASVLPGIVTRYESLQEESSSLREAARELADCDPAELASAREQLMSLDADVATKKQQIAELRKQLQDSTAEVQELGSRKMECVQAIEACEETREKYRGWTSREVKALRARVDAMEKKHGWAISGLSGSSLSMTYRREIELLIDVCSFKPVDVRLAAGSREQVSTDRQFMLRYIGQHVQTLSTAGASQLSELLRVVGRGWDKARLVARQISRINMVFPTKVAQTSETSLSVTSRLLLVPLKTLIEVGLKLDGSDDNDVAVSVSARVIYGEQFNEGKMGEFLAARIGQRVEAGQDWSDALVELRRRLVAKGGKLRA